MSEAPVTDELHDELQALIGMERDALVDPGPAARGRLAGRLAAQLQASPPTEPLGARLAAAAGSAASAAPSGVWIRGVLTGLGGFGAGVAVTMIVRSLCAPAPAVEIRYVDRVVEVDHVPGAAALAVQSSTPPVASVPAPAPAPPAPAPIDRPSRAAPAHIDRAAPAASAPATSTDDALARERQAIDKARSALARHDADAALAAVDEHAKAFPHGQLVEMREALAVHALVYAGRSAEARARAARFHQAFPASMYSPVVDDAISSLP